MEFLLMLFGIAAVFYFTPLIIVGLINLIFYKEPEIVLEDEVHTEYHEEASYQEVDTYHIDERA